MIEEFKLGERTYKVSIQDDIDDDGLGRTYAPLGVVKISKTWRGKSVPEDSMEQTLYHEITHAILDELGEFELSGNERFVQSFSLLLHQFEKTKK